MSKFIQPVSMVVTKEQYERDLRQPLLDMGYEELSIWNEFDIYPIVTNNEIDRLGYLGRVKEDRAKYYDRHFIDHYNPKLFLAIAAMTNKELGIVGEWWKCIDGNLRCFTNERMYKCQKYTFSATPDFIDDEGDLNGYYHIDVHMTNFKKATLQEIVAEFSISKPNPTTDTISIPSDSIESLNNLLDMPKDTLNNELINAVQGLLSLAHSYYNDEDITRGNECMNSISRLINNLDLE